MSFRGRRPKRRYDEINGSIHDIAARYIQSKVSMVCQLEGASKTLKELRSMENTYESQIKTSEQRIDERTRNVRERNSTYQGLLFQVRVSNAFWAQLNERTKGVVKMMNEDIQRARGEGERFEGLFRDIRTLSDAIETTVQQRSSLSQETCEQESVAREAVGSRDEIVGQFTKDELDVTALKEAEATLRKALGEEKRNLTNQRNSSAELCDIVRKETQDLNARKAKKLSLEDTSAELGKLIQARHATVGHDMTELTSSLKVKLELHRSLHQQQTKTWADRKATVGSDADVMSKALEAKKAELQVLEEKNAALAKDITSIGECVAEKSSIVSQLTEEKEKMAAQLKQVVEETEGCSVMIQELTSGLTSMRILHRKDVQQASSTTKDLESSFKRKVELRTDLQKYDRQLKDLGERVQVHAARLTDLQAGLQAPSQTVSSLKDGIVAGLCAELRRQEDELREAAAAEDVLLARSTAFFKETMESRLLAEHAAMLVRLQEQEKQFASPPIDRELFHLEPNLEDVPIAVPPQPDSVDSFGSPSSQERSLTEGSPAFEDDSDTLSQVQDMDDLFDDLPEDTMTQQEIAPFEEVATSQKRRKLNDGSKEVLESSQSQSLTKDAELDEIFGDLPEADESSLTPEFVSPDVVPTDGVTAPAIKKKKKKKVEADEIDWSLDDLDLPDLSMPKPKKRNKKKRKKSRKRKRTYGRRSRRSSQRSSQRGSLAF